MMETNSRASRLSLRNGVGTTEFHPIQQSPGITRTWEFADGEFRNLPLRPDQKYEHLADLRLGARGTLGPPPLFNQPNRTRHCRRFRAAAFNQHRTSAPLSPSTPPCISSTVAAHGQASPPRFQTTPTQRESRTMHQPSRPSSTAMTWPPPLPPSTAAVNEC